MQIFEAAAHAQVVPACVKTFVARRRHEGSKETSLARIKGKKI